MKEILNYIATMIKGAGINYAFLRWNAKIVYPYFIGEYSETEPTEEDQHHEYTFIITGFTRGSWAELEDAKEKIENLFNTHVATLPNGSAVVISYSGAFPIPLEEGELKKIQINVNIQEWRVK